MEYKMRNETVMFCPSDYQRGDEFLPGSPFYEGDRFKAFVDARDTGETVWSESCNDPEDGWNGLASQLDWMLHGAGETEGGVPETVEMVDHGLRGHYDTVVEATVSGVTYVFGVYEQ